MNVKDLNTQWELLCYQSMDHLKSHSLLLIHAVQFIAIAGRYLIPLRRDDSHMLLRWHMSSNMFAGNWIDAKKWPVKIGLKLPELVLTFLHPPSSEITSITMQGKTKEEIFEWMDERLHELEVELGPMKMELYYNLPDHETEHGIPFEIKNKEELIEIAKLRTDTELILRYFSSHFNSCKAHLINPYNLETSYKIPVERDDKGELKKYVVMGLAAPDSFLDHYYFYVKHYDRDEMVDFEKLQSLNGGGYWTIKDSILAVLPLFKLIEENTKEGQINQLVSFYKSALNATFEILVNAHLKLPD